MPGRAVWIQENTSRSHATLAFAGCHWRCLGRLAPFQGEGEGEGEGLISSRWQLVLTLTPHLHPLPFVRGEAIRPPGRRRACPTTRFDRVLLASHQLQLRRALAAASRLWSRPATKLSCFETRSLLPRRYLAALPSILEIPFLNSCLPDSFGVRSHVRYCTVTSVPTGISEKNLRAVSSGNRMQPCDAG